MRMWKNDDENIAELIFAAIFIFVEIFFMQELIFMIVESDEGGYTAKGLGISIFTQAETIADLKKEIIDAVHCHFDDNEKRIIRLHIVKEEIIAA